MRNIGNNYRYTNKSQWYYVSHNLLWVGGIQFLLDLPKYEAGINVDIKNRTKPYWNLLDRYGRPTLRIPIRGYEFEQLSNNLSEVNVTNPYKGL